MIIGITGQTGAGKSTVCNILSEKFNISVIDADLVAREVTNTAECRSLLKKEFGNDIEINGKLDRRKLAARAFESREKTDRLNQITHPMIIRKMLKTAKDLTADGVDKIIFDAPQLFESGLQSFCDYIVGFVADETIRKSRIMLRDGINEEVAEKRMKAGLSTEFFAQNCDIVIDCDGSKPPEELAQIIYENLPKGLAEF